MIPVDNVISLNPSLTEKQIADIIKLDKETEHGIHLVAINLIKNEDGNPAHLGFSFPDLPHLTILGALQVAQEYLMQDMRQIPGE